MHIGFRMNIFVLDEGEGEQEIINWLTDDQLPDYADDDVYGEVDIVSQKFVEELICIVKGIHQERVLTRKFRKEILIIIHELKYYEEIAKYRGECIRGTGGFCWVVYGLIVR